MEIVIDNLDFKYGDTHVLYDVNLRINEPGLVCIIGPNGVGKSTLVKCINRLLKPTSGKVTINGKNVNDMNPKEISSIIGFVPANNNDTFAMTVVDTVLIGRHNQQKWKTTPEDLEIVHRSLDMLNLSQFSMRSFNQLSAGQQQRVALARGIVQDTPILILDEPTSNLDVNHQIYVTELLRAFAVHEKKLILMICHDLNIAARYSHKIIVMKNPGIVYKIGTPEDTITEEVIREVYNVECQVINLDGKPHVILKSCIDDDT